MSLPDESQNDPLDAVLARQDPLFNNDSLRRTVLAGTLGVICRRRRLKRCAVAATLLGCYLAGIATMMFWRPIMDYWLKPSVLQTASNKHSSPEAAKPLPPEFAGPPAQKITSTPLSQFEVLRRAGDRYLREPEKLSLAVRTYSRALKYASAEERAISPEHDSWLLMALKDAHSKEIKHENQQL